MAVDFARDLFIPLGQAGAEAFDDTTRWVDDNGRHLSQRLWKARLDDQFAIDSILREAIVRGDDPLQAARRLEDFLLPAGRPVRNPETGRLVTWKRDDAGNLLRDSSGKLIPAQPVGAITRTPRSGAGSYSARRLARTEVTRAFGQATIQAAELNPFVEGVKWNLSSTHGKADECDANASNHSRGMALGVYAPNEVPRYPNHPHDKCYLSPVTTDDTDAVVAQLRRDFGLDGSPAVRLVTVPRSSGLREKVVALFRAAKALVTREAA